MTTFAYVRCDQTWPDGACPQKSLPARTVDEARTRAEADGWYLRPHRDLCPPCSGYRGYRPRPARTRTPVRTHNPSATSTRAATEEAPDA